METLKKIMRANIRQYGMIIALVVIMVFFQIVTGGVLLKPLNVTNLILQNSYILVLAVGMLLVIVSFNIDLSVGSLNALIGAVAAILMVSLKLPVYVGVPVALLLGGLLGAFQGWWIAYVKIPAFIVTLAGMLIFRGLTLTVLQGTSLSPFPESYQKISTGFIPDLFNVEGLHLTTIVIGLVFSIIYIFFEIRGRKTKQQYGFETLPVSFFIAKIAAILAALNVFMLFLAMYKGVPNLLVLLAFLIGVYTFITEQTVMGRHIYAVGGNAKAAQLSGVKAKSIVFWVFVNMGVLSALSGLVFSARLNAATPKAGVMFELDAIAACFIGGASTAGGVGTVMGAIIGGLVMGIMNNGMSLVGLGIDWQQTIKGLVLLLAVAFDLFTKSKH